MGTIFGTKGQIDIPNFYAANEATVLLYDENTTYTIKEENKENKFVYEALAVHTCLKNREIQSALVSWEHSLCAATIIDEALRQI